MNDVLKVPSDETWLGKCELGEWRQRGGLIYWRSPTWEISGYVRGADMIIPQLHAEHGCDVCAAIVAQLAATRLVGG